MATIPTIRINNGIPGAGKQVVVINESDLPSWEVKGWQRNDEPIKPKTELKSEIKSKKQKDEKKDV